MQNATKRQAGGILAFILIGIVLVALLGGGIYLSKQQGRVASQADTVATEDTAKTDDTTPDTASNTDTEGTTEGTTPQPQPQTTNPTPSTPAPATPAPTQDRTATGRQGVPTTGPSNIAATGPSDVIVPMLALSLLAGGMISYYRSRVTFRTAALK